MDTNLGNGRDARVAQLRAAAGRAAQVYPGPVGELLERELRAYADFGCRFGVDPLLDRPAADVLAG